MKPLTIKEMAAIMNNAVKLGYGDYALLVSDASTHCLRLIYRPQKTM